MAATYLFVPAHDDRKVERALASEVDAVLLDLEDSVPEAEKGQARAAVARALDRARAGGGPELWVRVNELAGPCFAPDLDAIDWSRVTGAVVPKAEDPDAVRRLQAVGVRQVILLIESVRGLTNLDHLADGRVVVRLALGTWDLSLDLGLVAVDDPDDSELIWQIRGQVVIESRRLGLVPPVDGIYARLHDDEGLRRACERAARMGFGAKLLVHPAQIPVARQVFGSGSDRLELAREIVAAYDAAVAAGHGAVRVRDRVVDRPMVARARALLARWEEAGR
jgi:citrate lyase subunit beta/citryl-CoA lyase